MLKKSVKPEIMSIKIIEPQTVLNKPEGPAQKRFKETFGKQT